MGLLDGVMGNASIFETLCLKRFVIDKLLNCSASLKEIRSVRCRTDGPTLAAYRECLDESMFDANQAEKSHQGAPFFLC